MQSFQVLEQIEILREVLSEDGNQLISRLSRFEVYKVRLEPLMRNLLDYPSDDPATIANFRATYRKEISEILSLIKKDIQARTVILEINRLREIFDSVLEELSQENLELDDISSQLTQFDEVYQEFINDYSFFSTLNLVDKGVILYHSLININESINITWRGLQHQYDDYDYSRGRISLFLNSDYSYKEFLEKLQALQNIYSELCYDLQVDESDFPLQIVKIESGSLYINIFGEPKIIELISSSIKNSVDYLYRNRTIEGKLEAIPRKVEIIESIVGLRKQLNEAGINTDELDNEIEKSSTLLGDELNRLLVGASGVVLDGEVILKEERSQKSRLISGSKQYLLPSAKDQVSDGDGPPTTPSTN